MPRPPLPLPDDVILFRAPPTCRARLGRVTATDATSITVDSLARVEPYARRGGRGAVVCASDRGRRRRH